MSELPELLATLSKFFVFADSIESNTDLEKKHYSTIHSILEQHFAPPDEAVEEALGWLRGIKFDIGPEWHSNDEKQFQTIRQALAKLDCISPDKNTK